MYIKKKNHNRVFITGHFVFMLQYLFWSSFLLEGEVPPAAIWGHQHVKYKGELKALLYLLTVTDARLNRTLGIGDTKKGDSCRFSFHVNIYRIFNLIFSIFCSTGWAGLSCIFMGPIPNTDLELFYLKRIAFNSLNQIPKCILGGKLRC